jgi:hypothetical protein
MEVVVALTFRILDWYLLDLHRMWFFSFSLAGRSAHEL